MTIVGSREIYWCMGSVDWKDGLCQKSFPIEPLQLILYSAFLVLVGVSAGSGRRSYRPSADQTSLGGRQAYLAKWPKTEPIIIPEILHKTFHDFVMPAVQFPIICTVSICHLSYAGFLRFSELASLRDYDIYFFIESISSGKELGFQLHVLTEISAKSQGWSATFYCLTSNFLGP